MRQCDTAIIGGGIVGLATAMALAEADHASLLVLEAENRLFESILNPPRRRV